MANALSGNKYNPEFFAAESLIQLEKALGLANRVHRGYERERNSFGRGDTITITRPSTFTAQTHVPGTGTTTQDIDTSKVQIVLDQWKEVKFQVRDDELAYGTEAIITDHIRPAAYALADAIDQSLMDLHIELGYATDVNTTVDVAEIYTLAKKDLRDRAVPPEGADYVRTHARPRSLRDHAIRFPRRTRDRLSGKYRVRVPRAYRRGP